MSLGNQSIATVRFPCQPWSEPKIAHFKALKFTFMWIKHRKKINQRAYYNRIWSWFPMPCEKHGPRASVTTKTSAFGLGFCLLSPSGHVFQTAWETRIKSYIIAFPIQDEILKFHLYLLCTAAPLLCDVIMPNLGIELLPDGEAYGRSNISAPLMYHFTGPSVMWWVSLAIPQIPQILMI